MGIEDVVFWHWWVIGLSFLVLEMVITAYFFLWLSGAAIVTGFILLVAPDLIPAAQWGIWATISIVSLLGYKLWRKKNPKKQDGEQSTLNRRGSQYVGRTFTLDAATENGQGKIKVDDTTWKVESETDLAKGSKIKVVDTEGTILKVEKV
jgi:hypothetical protein